MNAYLWLGVGIAIGIVIGMVLGDCDRNKEEDDPYDP